MVHVVRIVITLIRMPSSFCIQFCGFGYTTSFGVYQGEYLQFCHNATTRDTDIA